MPQVQVRNASMQELGSVDHLSIFDRNFGAEWYDHAGGQSFMLGNPALTLNLDTERINSAPEFYVMASDILTIAEAGLYLFSFQLVVSANGLGDVRLWLEQDPDTAVFALVPSAVTYFPSVNGVTGFSSGVITTLVQVGIDYRYRIRMEQLHGSTPITTVADCSRLSVIRLFKNG